MSYGVSTLRARSRACRGLEMLRAMIAGDLPAPPIAEPLGFRLVEVEKGRAVFEGEPGPHLLNPLGAVHGGWALTLIDSACGCAVHTELDAGHRLYDGRDQGELHPRRSLPTAGRCAARAGC